MYRLANKKNLKGKNNLSRKHIYNRSIFSSIENKCLTQTKNINIKDKSIPREVADKELGNKRWTQSKYLPSTNNFYSTEDPNIRCCLQVESNKAKRGETVQRTVGPSPENDRVNIVSEIHRASNEQQDLEGAYRIGLREVKIEYENTMKYQEGPEDQLIRGDPSTLRIKSFYWHLQYLRLSFTEKCQLIESAYRQNANRLQLGDIIEMIQGMVGGATSIRKTLEYLRNEITVLLAETYGQYDVQWFLPWRNLIEGIDGYEIPIIDEILQLGETGASTETSLPLLVNEMIEKVRHLNEATEQLLITLGQLIREPATDHKEAAGMKYLEIRKERSLNMWRAINTVARNHRGGTYIWRVGVNHIEDLINMHEAGIINVHESRAHVVTEKINATEPAEA